MTLWPDYFPEGCPPEDAFDAAGRTVYRFVSKNPPQEKDFQSQYQRALQRGKIDTISESKVCQAYGLSVFTEREEAETAQKVIPGMRKKKIAYAKLSEQMGVIKNTPAVRSRNHHTWWLPENPPEKPQDLLKVM